MRRSFALLLAPLGSHHLSTVEKKPLVWLDGNAEWPPVGLEKGMWVRDIR